jgi:tetratricopeptide (TPR) repeat protein
MAIFASPSRHRIRPIGIIAAALIVVAATYAAVPDLAAPGAAVPEAAGPAGRPVSPRTAVAVDVATVTGANVVDIDASIRTWSAKSAADENDYISATNLGILYLGRARLTSNLDDYSRAAAATGRALAADPSYVPARALDATLRYSIHDFDGALATARSLLADSPGDADALAVVGDASLELGMIDAARETYARLARLTPGPALDVRLARLAYLTGDPDRALEIARRAHVDAIEQGAIDLAFFDFQLGEFARLAGDATQARTAFEAALSIRPTHLGALVGLARVDAAVGDQASAIAILGHAAAIAPQPEVLALLGDLLAARGDEAAARSQYDIVRLSAQLSDLAGTVYDRQLIAFELDHGGASEALLEAARTSSAARPDAAGLDLVAWALHRLGRDDEAAAASDLARATGIVDARVTFHAGAIAVGRGDTARGRALLGEALALGPALDPAERAEAERLLAD